MPASSKENIAGNSSTLVGKAAEAQRVGAIGGGAHFVPLKALAQQVGQKHSANEGVKMQMHQMLFGRLADLPHVESPIDPIAA